MTDEQQQHEIVNHNNTEQSTYIAQCSRAHILRRHNADVPTSRGIWWSRAVLHKVSLTFTVMHKVSLTF